MAKIGIYGGSFNPPHEGHVLAAREAIRLLELDRLLIVPAFLPPHKELPPGSPDAEGRLALCRLAFSSVPGAEVCDLEIRRQGISYTVDTLESLHARYPGDELVLLMGTDMLRSFRNWYCPDQIARLATLAVMYRTQEPEEARLAAETEAIRTQLRGHVELVENQCVEISSSTVRRLIAMDCAQTYLPRPVYDAIRTHGYYACGQNWKQLPFEKLMEASLSLHKPQRVPHVIGCCQTAEQLARRWGADPEAARRAGILHDVTKALEETQQLLLCQRYDIILTNFERSNPKLLHAKTGAAVAEHIFGESPLVCDAIFWHTTGKADMTLLEKILYIADYMEPNRDFEGVQTLRRLVWEDLDAALLEGFAMSLELLKSRGKPVDPNSLQAWQYLSQERLKQ